MRYSEICESFDSGVGVHWEDRNEDLWQGRFVVGSTTFQLSFDLHADDNWICTFNSRDPIAMKAGIQYSNTGNAGRESITIFATVLEGINEFLAEIHPMTMSFTGSLKDGRHTLYQRMLSKYAAQLELAGYSIKSNAHDLANVVSDGEVEFKVTRRRSPFKR